MPFINIEYIFFKIYDFLGSVFGAGSGNNGFGYDSVTRSGMGGFLGSGKNFFEWMSGFFGDILSLVIIIATIAFVLLFIFIVYTNLRAKELKEMLSKKYKEHFIKPEPKTTRKNLRWEKIIQLFESHNQNDWRAAIMDADIMLDELLVSYNFPGENLGERLKNANQRLMSTTQHAWEAHKIRNRIAHEGPQYVLTDRDAQFARKQFEIVFRDAGIID